MSRWTIWESTTGGYSVVKDVSRYETRGQSPRIDYVARHGLLTLISFHRTKAAAVKACDRHHRQQGRSR